MFREGKIDTVAAQSPAPEKPPPKRKEIHVYVDRDARELRFEPRGTLEVDVQAEIVRVLGFPIRGGARDVVLGAVVILNRHGWETVDRWLDETKSLHVKVAKDVEE
jgi:hypothetical protein